MIIALSILLLLSACQTDNQNTDDTETTNSEEVSITHEQTPASEDDLLPSYFNWQSEQLFLVDPIAEPININEIEELNQIYLSTERPNEMQEDGSNPLFYSFEEGTLKTGHQILEGDSLGSPEEGGVATGSENLTTEIIDHSISNVSLENDTYLIETDNEAFTLTIESDNELIDQYGNRFTPFDTTFSELFDQFSGI